MDHNNITYETIHSASQSVQICKSLIQEFGVTLICIRGESNVVDDALSRIPMSHHSHKLVDTTL